MALIRIFIFALAAYTGAFIVRIGALFTHFSRIGTLLVMIVLLPGVWVCCYAQTPGTTKLKIYTENMPPYNYEHPSTRNAQGFTVDVLKGMLKRTGIAPENGLILVLPWARGYRLVQKQKNAMLFSMTKSKERIPLFKWVGPVAKREIWLWKNKTRLDIAVKSIEDAKLYSVGGVYDFASSQWLRQQGFRVEMTTSIEQNWRKLFLNRIDMVSALELEAAFNMKKLGKPFGVLKRLIRIDSRYDYYFALNKETDDEIVIKLQKALNDMKSDGTYESLKLNYMDETETIKPECTPTWEIIR
ncbi:MAG: ABC transporter substrate-binding protein [Desulfobacter sp.]|nr:MAG: ABC transporter substrate-binding protein [Desulfobacter sp.]